MTSHIQHPIIYDESYTAWCSEIGSPWSPDAPELHASVTSENQFHCTGLYNTQSSMTPMMSHIQHPLIYDESDTTPDHLWWVMYNIHSSMMSHVQHPLIYDESCTTSTHLWWVMYNIHSSMTSHVQHPLIYDESCTTSTHLWRVIEYTQSFMTSHMVQDIITDHFAPRGKNCCNSNFLRSTTLKFSGNDQRTL